MTSKIHQISLKLSLIIILFATNLPSQDISNTKLNTLLSKKDILNVDEAFELKVALLKENRIQLSWNISENCYLYKDNFSFEFYPAEEINISPFRKGKKKLDEYFGEVEVFYSNLVIFIDLKNKNPTKLKLTYQGCNETGYCYPPVKKLLKLYTGEKELIIEAI